MRTVRFGLGQRLRLVVLLQLLGIQGDPVGEAIPLRRFFSLLLLAGGGKVLQDPGPGD